MDNIFLLPLTDGKLLPALLSIHSAGDDDAALHALGGYAYETEDAWALLPDDAWAVFTYKEGVLDIEVFSAHTQRAVLRRRLSLLLEEFESLVAGVLVFTAPMGNTLEGVRPQIERGEWDDLPLSIGVRVGRHEF